MQQGWSAGRRPYAPPDGDSRWRTSTGAEGVPDPTSRTSVGGRRDRRKEATSLRSVPSRSGTSTTIQDVEVPSERERAGHCRSGCIMQTRLPRLSIGQRPGYPWSGDVTSTSHEPSTSQLRTRRNCCSPHCADQPGLIVADQSRLGSDHPVASRA